MGREYFPTNINLSNDYYIMSNIKRVTQRVMVLAIS
jgi:hypothetical protein